MSQVNETIVWGNFNAAPGTVVASAELIATEAAGAQVKVSVTPGQTSASIDLTAGTWTVKCQALDATGAAVGPAAVDPNTYTVAVPTTITVQIPTGLTGVAS